MSIHPGVVGIDISKFHLDLFDPRVGRPERIDNTAEAAAALAGRLAAAGDRAVMEATGSYDRALREALRTAGVGFSRVNPGQARAFARAAGFLAKTDAVDARMLALMGQALELRPDAAPEAERERLGRLHRRRDQLVAMRAQERNRRKEWADEEIAASIDEHIAWLARQIAELDGQIRRLIRSSPMLSPLEQLLRSIPGVGPVAAVSAIALVPELGRRSPKTIAALVGLAPYNADSGARRGQRSIRGGRKRVRDAFYMAAVAASRSDGRFGRFYAALRQAGKPPKVAFIALARKLLVTANALVRDQLVFQP
jgi:transposase